MKRGFSRGWISAKHRDIDPDEIFLDDRNLPKFDTQQFEGRLETPIPRGAIIALGSFFILVGIVFVARAGYLEVIQGETFAKRSEQNRLDHAPVFAERGVITDRNGVRLAWNEPPAEGSDFPQRVYTSDLGFAHLLGFVRAPAKDGKGNYYRTEYEPEGGVEQAYDSELRGHAGTRLIEVDAIGRAISGNVIDPPKTGDTLRLSIDARVQKKLAETIATTMRTHGWRGGAGAVMNIDTGSLLAITSMPEYDPNVMASGTDRATISGYYKDPSGPFIFRAVSGLYTPGSIVKVIDALGALHEGTITPNTHIYSSGKIVIPNPYHPGNDSVFTDWRAQGMMDLARGIAVSSNVYFYEVGGGFKDQPGLGIVRLEKYFRAFGFGAPTGFEVGHEATGTIPNPEWKAKNFDGDPWRLGDTYFTSIGQYGVQITLLQALREAATIASKGKVVRPHLTDDEALVRTVDISESNFNAVHKGMRLAVDASDGTAKKLSIPGFPVAGKTGTAELGVSKSHVNSWVIGFFPADHPKYAFAVVMERGVKGTAVNASSVMAEVLHSMAAEMPEYTGVAKIVPRVQEPAAAPAPSASASSTPAAEEPAGAIEIPLAPGVPAAQDTTVTGVGAPVLAPESATSAAIAPTPGM